LLDSLLQENGYYKMKKISNSEAVNVEDPTKFH